jgi:hypothetical protein
MGRHDDGDGDGDGGGCLTAPKKVGTIMQYIGMAQVKLVLNILKTSLELVHDR